MGFILITLLLDVIGFGIIIPVMPRLITELTQSDMSDAALYGGWLMFSFAVMQFICSPVIGNLSDQYGRRKILLFSLFGFGMDYLLLAFAPSITWLFIGRILAGITGASFTTASAYIADVSPPEKRAQNFGMIGATFGLGFIIGPVLGGILGQYGSRIPFYVAAALTLLNWLYGYFVLPESLDDAHRRPFEWKRANPFGALRALRKYPLVSGLILSLTLVYIAAHAVQSTWTFFTMETLHWNEAMVGYSLGVVGLLVAIVQGGLIRLITPRLGQKYSVYLGMALYAVALFLFAFATSTLAVYGVIAVYCLGGIAGPALQSLISNQVPPNEQGELQGALTSIMSFTSIIGPPLMTNTFHYFTSPDSGWYFPGASFFLAGIFTLLSLIFATGSLKAHFAEANRSE